jgi:hypothetical protein
MWGNPEKDSIDLDAATIASGEDASRKIRIMVGCKAFSFIPQCPSTERDDDELKFSPVVAD